MARYGLSEDGNTITLKKFTGDFKIPEIYSDEWIEAHSSELATGLVFDVETTGFDSSSDVIIEVGLRQFKFERKTGTVVKIGDSYSGLQDPKEPLSPEIKKLTHLDDQMLKDQVIDWDLVSQKFFEADLIIAHNAAFDRSFADQVIEGSAEKIWACSCNQIDWLSKDFSSRSLSSLANSHGFFYDPHRALSDADAILYLLCMKDFNTGYSYLNELLQEARAPLVQVIAANSPFERKNLLKRRGYKWDMAAKKWFCIIDEAKKDEEVSWLEEKIYNGSFPGFVKPMRRCDNFKSY